eukprot:1160519-Pelagomonas_calceolata.AAC.2
MRVHAGATRCVCMQEPQDACACRSHKMFVHAGVTRCMRMQAGYVLKRRQQSITFRVGRFDAVAGATRCLRMQKPQRTIHGPPLKYILERTHVEGGLVHQHVVMPRMEKLAAWQKPMPHHNP